MRRVACHGGGSGRNAVKSWGPAPLQLRAVFGAAGAVGLWACGPLFRGGGGCFRAENPKEVQVQHEFGAAGVLGGAVHRPRS